MANKRLPMRKIKEVLRLKHVCGLGEREIAHSCQVSRTTVGNYLKRAAASGLSWSLVAGLSEAELESRLFHWGNSPADPPRPLPDCQYIYDQLRDYKKVNLTLTQLWLEYLEHHPDGYQYTQFCEYYHRWEKRQRLTMRQTYRGGEKLFVDYAGQHVWYELAGLPVQCELFVGVLGASSYTYAEATHTQQMCDFTESHVRAFGFFGGVPAVVVPDQLKSAVTVSDRYEPGLNRTYADLARHYGTCIVPARPARPRDKAKVEAGVQVAERWILARLRDERPGSLARLNERIGVLLAALNGRPMKGLGVSRRELFERVDKPFLRPLPAETWEYAEWKPVKVSIDYHVEFGRHYYSVPFSLVGETVEARVTTRTVELFHRSQRIAVHRRSGEAGAVVHVRAHDLEGGAGPGAGGGGG